MRWLLLVCRFRTGTSVTIRRTRTLSGRGERRRASGPVEGVVRQARLQRNRYAGFHNGGIARVGAVLSRLNVRLDWHCVPVRMSPSMLSTVAKSLSRRMMTCRPEQSLRRPFISMRKTPAWTSRTDSESCRQVKTWVRPLDSASDTAVIEHLATPTVGEGLRAQNVSHTSKESLNNLPSSASVMMNAF